MRVNSVSKVLSIKRGRLCFSEVVLFGHVGPNPPTRRKRKKKKKEKKQTKKMEKREGKGEKKNENEEKVPESGLKV